MSSLDFVAVSDNAGDLAGVSTWFQLNSVQIDAEALRQAGIAAGIAEADMPKNTTAKAALRRACAALTDKRTLARNLKSGGWAIVQEVPIGDTLTHAVATTVELDSFSKLIFQTGALSYFEKNIMDNFAASLLALDAADISSWLVRTAERLNGVALRDRGGIYFMPRQSLDTWHTATSVLRQQSKGCDVYEMPTLRSSEAVRSIIAALTREALSASEEIMQNIDSGKLGERALRSKSAECMYLTNKLASYEILLDSSLSVIKSRLEEVSAAATVAALSVNNET